MSKRFSTERAATTANPSDRDYLLQLARDKTVAGRRLLTSTISDLFFERTDVLSDREWALMTDILRQLIRTVETSVRRVLAEQLATISNAPASLIITLANDEIEVAHPILVQSEVLQDFELIEIIRHRTMEHQLAIALRKEVSEQVSDALVATENVDVIKTLLDNQQAQISRATLEYLVEQSQRVDTYQNPLLQRAELDTRLASRMYWWVSAALRSYILENFDVDQSTLDESLELAVHNLTDDCDEDPMSKALALVDKIAETQAISPQLIVSALRNGEVPLFTAMFSRFTGIRTNLVSRMLYEPGGEGLCIACRGANIDKATFAALSILSRKVQNVASPDSQSHITEALKLFDRLTVSGAAEMLKKWRRDPDFLRAIWQVEQVPSDAFAY